MTQAAPVKRAIKGTTQPVVFARERRKRAPAAPAASERDVEQYDLANAAILAAALGTGIYIDTFI